MAIEENEFIINATNHKLVINRSGGYHAYPKYSRKEFKFETGRYDLRKKGIDFLIWNIRLELTKDDILKYFKKKVNIDKNTSWSEITILSTRIILGIQFMNFDTNKWENVNIKSMSYFGFGMGCNEHPISIFLNSKSNNQRFINKENLNMKVKIFSVPLINESDFK